MYLNLVIDNESANPNNTYKRSQVPMWERF